MAKTHGGVVQKLYVTSSPSPSQTSIHLTFNVRMSVPHFSADQRRWLDNQIAVYNYCDEHNDLVNFWSSLFEVFFACWPEHVVLFPDLHGPAPLSFTKEQKQVLDDAVVTKKHVGTSLIHIKQADHCIIVAHSRLDL